MPAYGSFDVKITVDDAALPEYDLNINVNERIVSCWIPSETGKPFTVRWKNLSPVTDTVGLVYLDGKCTGSKSSEKGRRDKVERSYIRISQDMVRPYTFSTLTLTDDDAHLDNPVNDLGEIRLVLSRCVILPPYPITGSQSDAERHNWRDIDRSGPVVHERSKKGLVHQAGFGDQYSRPAHSISVLDRYEDLVTFVFKYRPLDVLQAHGIVPKPPSPKRKAKSTGQKRKARDLESEVLEISDDPSDKEDDQRLKALEAGAEIQQIKTRRKKQIKTEPKPVVFDGVIDLT
ncbi:hypothetical protein AMATHDRAFT_5861 [Amanita thiersii Skay4041]|uniref:DUF7918 domain-containing protein n=1 Tax=Amanita thiersii Skay4041 TaxID=703135 RepID=A0A2A9NJE8_9AGAR|nr:hypothetical protein AMATHDRAFT_5861 [Amanita thiersii Skay4041]